MYNRYTLKIHKTVHTLYSKPKINFRKVNNTKFLHAIDGRPAKNHELKRGTRSSLNEVITFFKKEVAFKREVRLSAPMYLCSKLPESLL